MPTTAHNAPLFDGGYWLNYVTLFEHYVISITAMLDEAQAHIAIIIDTLVIHYRTVGS